MEEALVLGQVLVLALEQELELVKEVQAHREDLVDQVDLQLQELEQELANLQVMLLVQVRELELDQLEVVELQLLEEVKVVLVAKEMELEQELAKVLDLAIMEMVRALKLMVEAVELLTQEQEVVLMEMEAVRAQPVLETEEPVLVEVEEDKPHQLEMVKQVDKVQVQEVLTTMEDQADLEVQMDQVLVYLELSLLDVLMDVQE